MGFQSPSAFSAITPTSPNWPLKPLQWVLLGHWGASPHPPPHQLPPTQWVPRATISVTSQSLCPSYLPQSWLSPHSSGTCTPVAQLCRGIATVSRMKSAASIELKTGPPKCTAQSPGLYNNDGILLCFSQSLKPFFTSLSVANCVSCFTEKIKPIPLENPQHPSSNLNPLSPPRASLLQRGPITSHCCGSLPLYPQISVFLHKDPQKTSAVLVNFILSFLHLLFLEQLVKCVDNSFYMTVKWE